MLFADQAAGTATANIVTGERRLRPSRSPGAGHPAIVANELRGGEYGLTYLEGAGGEALRKTGVLDHRVGLQLAGTAAPRLVSNELDGIQEAAIVYVEIGPAARPLATAAGALRRWESPSRRLLSRRSMATECEIVRAG